MTRPVVSLVVHPATRLLLSAATLAAATCLPSPTALALGQDCSRQLRVAHTEKADGCWIDERVTAAPGLLEYACEDGEAIARFGSAEFQGSVASGRVTLKLETRFDFRDGCRWRSSQLITGRLADKELSYTYAETPLPGQRNCASACVAHARVKVLPAPPG